MSRAGDDGQLAEILGFIRRLESNGLHYKLKSSRDDALMVEVHVPGQIWEVEFLEDGSVDVERFMSTGNIGDRSALVELFAEFGEPRPALPAG